MAARSVLDGCEHDGILIAETDDAMPPPDRYWLPRADQDAPFRRGFMPPLTGDELAAV